MLRSHILLALAAMALSGCGSEQKAGHVDSPLASRESPSPLLDVDKSGSMSPENRFRDAPAAVPSQRTAEPQERKIIYNSELDLVVSDFSGVQRQVDQLLAAYGGAYIAQMQIEGNAGESRRGTWTIRVPAGQNTPFLDRLRPIGQVVREEKKADDVSEEYYDLEARLRNKRQTEARLVKLQQDRTGELKDILAVEEQIDRVRAEIEQMQGRLERLATLTSMATITLTVEEIKNYQPAATVTLGDRIGTAFFGSLWALRAFGENLLLFLTALAPWLPLAAAALFAARLAVRRFRRSAPPASA